MELIKKHLQEKNKFITKMYEEASAYGSMSSVSMDPFEIGKELDFDEKTTERVAVELTNDKLISASLGLGVVFISNRGIEYVRSLFSKSETPSSSTFQISGTNVQVSNNSPNSQQTITNNNIPDKEQFQNFINEVRNKFDEIKNKFDDKKFEELKDEIDYLEKTINRQNPDNSKIKTTFNTIFELLKETSAHVLGHVIYRRIHG